MFVAVIVVLYVGVRRQKKKETLMTSKEDIRDNVIHYDDEGGGEEDTHAFDMGTLRNPKVIKDNLFRRDVKPELGSGPRRPIASQNSADISNFISQRLQEHDGDTAAPPYDSLATYAYEGEGSVAESLSSIESVKGEPEEDFDYLNEWGLRFKTLAGIFGERSESQSDVTSTTTTENKHWWWFLFFYIGFGINVDVSLYLTSRFRLLFTFCSLFLFLKDSGSQIKIQPLVLSANERLRFLVLFIQLCFVKQSTT